MLIGKSLAVLAEKFSFNPQFLGKNAKIDFFEEKMVLSVVLSNFNAGSNKLV